MNHDIIIKFGFGHGHSRDFKFLKAHKDHLITESIDDESPVIHIIEPNAGAIVVPALDDVSASKKYEESYNTVEAAINYIDGLIEFRASKP